MTTVRVFTTYDLLSEATAAVIADAATQAIKDRGIFRVALSGGETPRGYLTALAKQPYKSQMDWKHWDIWWGDDRIVPHDDADSNVLLARTTLLNAVPIAPEHIHAPQTDLPSAECASAYEAEIIRELGPEPRCDLVLLGIGEDGHTASLFPNTPGVNEQEHFVIATESPKPPRDRVSFTFRTINAARLVVFVVTGESKSEPLRQVLAPHAGPLPAARVAPADGRLLWIVDCSLGRGLHPNPTVTIDKNDSALC